jgi:peptidoglycan/xylan/chitin deacetylase (PgdA/CDA1 family)
MYHSISNSEEKGVSGYYKINTSPKVFNEHVKYVYDNGYSVINLSDIAGYLRRDITDSNKFLAITFDDGYRDFYTNAFPILKQYSFSCDVFLPTSYIGNSKPGLKGKEHLSWGEIRELTREGIRFGSHTVTHPQLKSLSKDVIEYELDYSKKTIEDNIGEEIKSFSYPFAFPEENKEFRKLLRDCLISCGYKNGVNTSIGTTTRRDDILFMKRIPVNTDDDIPFFRAKLESAYDWLHGFQLFSKFLRAKVS